MFLKPALHKIENRLERNVIRRIEYACLRAGRQYIEEFGWAVFPLLITQTKSFEKVLNHGEPFKWRDIDWNSKWFGWGNFQIRSAHLNFLYKYWSGIAVVLGKVSNLVCVDIDNHSGHANNSWIVPSYIPLEKCVYDRSQSGGYHFYFRWNERLTNTANKTLEYEVRANNQFVILPPSRVLGPVRHIRSYSWINSPDKVEVPEFPDGLYDFIYGKSPVVRPSVRYSGAVTEKQKAVLKDKLERCLSAKKGERSERDFDAVVWAVKIGLDKGKAYQVFKDIGKFKERGIDYFDLTWEKAEQCSF
jgi:hypothetical protein